MNDAGIRAVERVIRYMYENLGEEITIDDMARTAMFSKFHFSRIFHDVTGISPGRFLSAIRLQAAKRLLISTSLTVTDICYRAGYTSVGTFSSRFAAVVGIPPTAYREGRGYMSQLRVNGRRNNWGTCSGMIRGQVTASSAEAAGLIFIGVFPDPIIQGQPIRYTVLRDAGSYVLDDVPQGTWYVLGHAFARGDSVILRDPANDDRPPSVASHGPITVRPDMVTRHVDVRMRPMRVTDPPMLLALLDVA